MQMPQIDNQDKVVYREFSYDINSILFKVAKDLGRFKTEKQYGDAIEYELKQRSILYEREKSLKPSFNNEQKGRNKIDFIIYGKIILEIKAKPFLTKEDYYQTKRYLEALNLKLAILVNMRAHRVYPKRILNSKAEA